MSPDFPHITGEYLVDRIELKSERRRGRGARPSQRRRLRPSVMALEGRALLSTFTVDSTADDGSTGTLRWAIGQANADNQADTIVFSSLFNTPQTIALSGSPLTLTNADTTTIDGPGASLLTVNGENMSRAFNIYGASAEISGLTLSGGASDRGGAIRNINGTLTLTDAVISGNTAFQKGGGVYSQDGTTTLSGCTVSGNTAIRGGGLAFDGGALSLTDCTISGNTAGFQNGPAGSGGGVYTTSGTATLTNCTVSGNSTNADGYLGGLCNLMATVSLTNTIVAGNNAGDIGNGYAGTNNIIGGSPLLAPLGDYGGPTPTMALLPGSPALGGGTASGAPTTDQRGQPRSGDVDIGAFQSQGTALVVNTASDGNFSGLGELNLRQAINLANVFSTPDTISFSSLFDGPQMITLTAGQLDLRNNATTTIGGPGSKLLTINGNHASRVFYLYGGSAAVSGLTVTGGYANFGGGVVNERGNLTLTSVILRGNQASTSQGYSIGGGLDNDGTTTLSDCTISGNSAVGPGHGIYGGGIDNESYGTLSLTNCTISNNSSGYSGGGLFNKGTATLTDVTLSGNSATLGGGLITNGMLAMTGCTVSGNSAATGAGLVASGGDSTLADCTLSGNSASGDGGGAYNEGQNANGTLALVNCTVSGNSAGGAGGGLNNEATMSLFNCTVSGNTGHHIDGGVANYGTLSLSNTIVAGNNGGDVGGSYSGSNNLIGGNPLLAALGDYGGPIATMALLPGSPAIGGGTSTGAPAFDQRGQPRSGHVDIGAFQSQGFTITPVAGNNAQSTPVNQPFPKPLVFTVTANNQVEPVDAGIVRFTVTPVDGASATLSAATATIAGGVASVTAAANSTMGKYIVSASASGADPDGFVLTNTERPSLVVTTNLDEMNDTDGLTSLREAIAYADSLPGPSTITFAAAFFGTKRRTIRLTGGPLVLSDPATTTIVGPGARQLTIGGGGKSRVFDVEGGSLALSGVTIANGNANLGGGIRNEGGRLVLTKVLIQGNRAIVGGGLYNDGHTTLSAVTIKGNRAHVGARLFNTRGATLLWRRSPAASRASAHVDHTQRGETA
jgi:parallel beta-helix repeat protein